MDVARHHRKPGTDAAQYETLWKRQLDDPRSFYDQVRADFNRTGSQTYFCICLHAACKGSVRYNSQGEFNQSPDNRRQGMLPETMRLQILGAAYYFKGRTTISSVNYRDVLDKATPVDLVYMDPPIKGSAAIGTAATCRVSSFANSSRRLMD